MKTKPGSAQLRSVLAVHQAGRAYGKDRTGMRHDSLVRLRELGAALLALALASGALLALARAAWPDAAPSLLTLLAGSVPTLLAPLFWPGPGAPGQLRRALTFAACVGAMVLIGAAWLGAGRHLWSATIATAGLAAAIAFGCCGCLVAVRAAMSHAADPRTARAFAVPVVALVLWFCAAAPVWLAPLAASMTASPGAVPWLADALLAISPLAQLATAAGNDLLRNDWFYAWSALSDMRVEYPRLWIAVPVWLALGCATLRTTRRAGRRRGDDPSPTTPALAVLESS